MSDNKAPSAIDERFLAVLQENYEASKRIDNKIQRGILIETYEDLISIFKNGSWRKSAPSIKEDELFKGLNPEILCKPLVKEDTPADEFYPGYRYQRLFNYLADLGVTALQGEMNDIIQIVEKDFTEPFKEEDYKIGQWESKHELPPTKNKVKEDTPIDMTAEEFYSGFNLDFLTEEEKQTIYTATELYAKGKLRVKNSGETKPKT